MANEKQHTIQLMLEQEERHLEALRQESATSSVMSSKRQAELDAALRRVARLKEQLKVRFTVVHAYSGQRLIRFGA